MPGEYIASVDQGTASSRCIDLRRHGAGGVGEPDASTVSIFPRPGWVEHDAAEIWANVLTWSHGALPRRAAAAGRSSSRSASPTSARPRCCGTARTGEPVHNAIVWQDTRTGPLWSRARGRRRPGPLHASAAACRWPRTSPAPKMRWLLDNVAGPARAGRARRGAVRHDRHVADLEPHRRRHVTDVTNASRTMLMNLRTLDWDDELLDAFGVPRAMLPEIRSSSEVYGQRRRCSPGVPVAARARRPAGGAVRPDLLQPGRGQVHLRHRQLPAAEHRRRAGRSRRTGCSPPSATGSASSRRRTRWRARSRSPARWCSGCATTSG